MYKKQLYVELCVLTEFSWYEILSALQNYNLEVLLRTYRILTPLPEYSGWFFFKDTNLCVCKGKELVSFLPFILHIT